ncbi:peptide-methionine (S)-S-oxide reductase [Arenibacter sp. F26102]|uniref:peptide-methionine (S)-S-oxide reductase n=1 Tax=Arenibacter sp. F26102 TaxID=2926416 RepID=UPI001FF33359|nr:peptide-methionine (S)-S-oxide reductase [Arenibacter sp. F26102]MCK0146578.1 peptide-methionine (S)-S-oxide reductase [Arenibacter sp. F26102]
MKTNQKIGFGGGCHWCTEAVYQSLKGVGVVEQGFVAPKGKESSFSEAVIVYYDSKSIALEDLILIHLHTHKSTSDHSMRNKYRSAIYTFDPLDTEKSKASLQNLQERFKKPLVTKVLPFGDFKLSDKAFQNYYFNNPQKPFCDTYIAPKLRLLSLKFGKHVDESKVLGQ